MPNVVAPIHSRVLAAYPEATLAERGERHVKFRLADLPDGRAQWRVEQSAGVLHYLDAGAWAEIDTDWRDSDDVNYTDRADRGPGRFYVGANSDRRVYPRRDVPGEYLSFEGLQYYSNRWRNLNLTGKLRSSQDLTWDNANLTVKLISGGTLLKFLYILKNSAAPTRIRWSVGLTGLHWQGWNLISDADGTVVATVTVPRIVSDAVGPIPRPGRLASMTLVGSTVELGLDLTGLSYPVTVDPDIDLTGASGDDGYDYAGSWLQNGWSNLIYVGKEGTDADDMGLRFQSVAIAQGSTVSDATIQLYAINNTGTITNVHGRIYADDVDDAPAWSTSSHPASGFTNTTAYTAFDPSSWPANQYNSLPSCHGAVGEVIARAGWVSGNDLRLAIRDNASSSSSNVTARTAAYGAGTEPLLGITYTTGASSIVVSLSGTGTASATLAGVKTQVAAALTGTGSLSASPSVETQIAAALTGTGTLSANVEASHAIAAALTGAGSLVAADVAVASQIAAALTGTGSLSANVDLGAVPIAASLTGTGSLSADATVSTTIAAALTGTGTLSATASVVSAGSIAAALTGTGTLAVTEVTITSPVAAALSGTGSLVANIDLGAIPIAASLTGTGTLSASVEVVVAGSIAAALTGTGSLVVADVTVTSPVAGSLSGTGSLSAGVTVVTTIAAALTGTGSLSATLDVVPVAGIAAALTGTGTLTASTVTVSVPITANLTGEGTLRATVVPDVVVPAVVVPQPRGSIVNIFEFLRDRGYYLRAEVLIELVARARLPEVVLEGARAWLALGAPSIRAARLPGALANLAVVWSRAGQPALVEVTAPDAEDWRELRRQLAELRRERLEWRGAVAALRERDDDAEMLRWLLMA